MCLATTLCSLNLCNPLILCSGVLDMTRRTIERLPEVGAVVTKSASLRERTGYGNPSVVELGHGILNAMGLPNPGIDAYIQELSGSNVDVLIGSVFGENEDEFVQSATRMATISNAIEMNMSCPHANSYGAGVPTDHIANIVSSVKKAVSIPVFVKLGVDNINERAHQAIEGGADALVAINTVKGMAIDVETGMPILANIVGGYSGPAIKPIGVRCVYELASTYEIPIVGVGGISSAMDVVEYMMAGASAVQIGSAFYYGGKTVFSEISSNLRRWLNIHGHEHIGDVIGTGLLKHNRYNDNI